MRLLLSTGSATNGRRGQVDIWKVMGVGSLFPKVSVVIPFYNCPYVDQAIRSVLDQTYGNLEIIVVNDGATRHTDKIAPFHGKLKYFATANGGTARALNYGVRHASGQYVAWLSSDDLFHPDKVARQLSYMLAHRAWVSCTNYDLVDANNDTIQSLAGKRPTEALQMVRAFLTGNPVHGCTVMARRELFANVGYFNEMLRCTQDYEMWIRIALAGFEFRYLDEPLTRFRWHGGNGTLLHQDKMEKEIQAIHESYNPLLNDWLERNGTRNGGGL